MVWFHSSSLPVGHRHRSPKEHEQILKEIYGRPGYRGVQREAIESVVAGEDVLAIMPTGGGKSMCYQVPALVLEGTALVISPLIALMRDQADKLRRLGVRASALVGGDAMLPAERAEIETALVSGSMDILFVSPERLAVPRFRELLRSVRLSLVAIDEAHCVCDWGKDFRPEYLRIGELLNEFPRVPRVALTASATAGMQAEIADRLLSGPRLLSSGFDRPNITLEVVERGELSVQLGELLRARLRLGSALVYCGSRRQTDDVARLLSAQGFSAGSYHAGMAAAERSQVQDAFVSGALSVVVATSAFGMGIDKSDVATVAHVGLPASVEAYYQESGRAGRDGREALAWLAWARSDVGKRMRIVHANEDEVRRRQELIRFEAVMAYVEAPKCRRNALLLAFGQFSDGPCGRCDLCRRQLQLRDASEDVKLVLEAVFDMRQDASSGLVAEVLSGMATARVRTAGLENVGAFGRLRKMGDDGVRKLLRQLMGLGLIAMDERDGLLAVTRQGEDVMDGAAPVMLPGIGDRARVAKAGDGLPQWRVDQWHELRRVREEVAAERGVDANSLAADALLAGIVANQLVPAGIDQDLAGRISAALERHLTKPPAPVAIDTGLF